MRIGTRPYIDYTSKLECTKRLTSSIAEKEMALPMLVWILGSAHGSCEVPVNGVGQRRGYSVDMEMLIPSGEVAAPALQFAI
jgi:hypothetical protein